LSTIEIASYAKVGEQFIPIADFKGPVDDPEYFEGAIEFYIDGQMISSIPYWDDVNYLWDFLVGGVEKLARSEEWSTFWPDQPIRLSFTPLPMNDLVRVERTGSSDPDVQALANRPALMAMLLVGAAEFVEVYGRFANEDWVSEVQKKIRELQTELD